MSSDGGRSPGTRPGRAGPAIAVLGVALTAVTVALDVRTAGTAVPARAQVDPGWLSALSGLAQVVPGALLQRRLPRNPIAWVLLVSGLVWCADGLAASWLTYGAYTAPGAPGTAFALWFYFRFGATLLLGIPVLLLLFPDGRLPSGRWRLPSAVSLACTALLPALLVVVPSDVVQQVNGPLPPPLDTLSPDPFAVALPFPVWRVLLQVAYVLTAVNLLVPLAVTVHRYRTADGVARAQLRWLLWAALVGAAVLLVSRALPGTLNSVLLTLSVALTSIAVVVAVTRYRLYAIDGLLSATVVYGLLSLSVVAVDLAVFAAAGTALGERDAALAAVAVVAVAYAPLRERVWSLARRAVRGGREDPYGVVSTLAERLEGSGTADEQLGAVAAAVADAFRSPYVRVEIDQASGGRLVVEHAAAGAAPGSSAGSAAGSGGDRDVVLPVTYRGEAVGRLVLRQGRSGTRLRPEDQRLLADVVRQAAAAARATALSEELQRSREQLVAGREEERRRLRRDLHDGLGPSLAAVTLRIETARSVGRTAPEAADRLLEAATEDVAAILADVRRLVHDLRPPALDELGLLGAVRQLATRFDGLQVRVDGEGGLDGLPAAVEVAAYRIVSEALSNAARHARAGAVVVRLGAQPGELEVVVRDDGVGIAPDVTAGVGLVSLRERAEELGGRCEVTCPPGGGTAVRAVLPLAAVTAQR